MTSSSSRHDTGFAFATIIAKNYLASARTLCESLKRWHPHIPRYVLFIDGAPRNLDFSQEPYLAVDIHDLAELDLIRWSFKYDVVEFATAVKPLLIQHLFSQRGHSALAYLDPDIFVLNPLDDLLRITQEYNLVLTPHLDAVYPDEDHHPNTQTFLIHGIYNLGFLGIRNSEETRRFLRWWTSHLEDECVRDRSSGHFVDQKVIDLVPHVFRSVRVESHCGYNVAYWNIHSRRVTRTNGQWRCNDQPLYFFHFSEFDPHRPDQIAPRAYTRDAALLGGDLPVLLREYAELLLRNGFDQWRSLPYGYNSFANGEVITYEIRQRYRRSRWMLEKIPDPFRSRRLILDNRILRLQRRHPHLARLATTGLWCARQIGHWLRRATSSH